MALTKATKKPGKPVTLKKEAAATEDRTILLTCIPARGTKLPKTLAACADELYAAKAQRAVLAKQADALEQREIELRKHLLEQLPKTNATGTKGVWGNATIEEQPYGTVKDWTKFSKWLAKEAATAPETITTFLQKRASGAAILERYKGSKKFANLIPGTEIGKNKVISITKA
jgi:hypothetical protein